MRLILLDRITYIGLCIRLSGVSEKKYGVADYQYYKNGNTQQCNILRHNKNNFSSSFMCNFNSIYVSYECETNDESNGSWMIKQQI